MYLQRVCFYFCSLTVLTANAYAHKEWVHQYVVREGYNLLRLHHGADIPQMVKHVSWQEGYTRAGSWTAGLIAGGAWLEVVYDPGWEWSGSVHELTDKEISQPRRHQLEEMFLEASTSRRTIPTLLTRQRPLSLAYRSSSE